MSLIETIIDNVRRVKEEGSYGVVYEEVISRHRYVRLVYFPNWDMFFLYRNKELVGDSPNPDDLIALIKEPLIV